MIHNPHNSKIFSQTLRILRFVPRVKTYTICSIYIWILNQFIKGQFINFNKIKVKLLVHHIQHQVPRNSSHEQLNSTTPSTWPRSLITYATIENKIKKKKKRIKIRAKPKILSDRVFNLSSYITVIRLFPALEMIFCMFLYHPPPKTLFYAF